MINIKRTAALIMAIVMLLGCFTGCGKEAEPALEVSQANSSSAMGRYVEESIPLPEGISAMDMVMLTTGQLRVAAQDENENLVLYTTGSDRSTWEDTQTLPAEIPNSGYIESLALSPNGEAFCTTVQAEDGTDAYQYHFWVIDASGESREIPITYPELDAEESYLVASCDFTADGRLIALFYFQDVREVDLETGGLSENLNESESFVCGVRCAGESIYLLGSDSASVCREDTSKALSGVLEEQLAASMQATEGYNPKITFWEDPDGYLLFTTHDGLYSYVPGGSITEELVSGARSTLGDPYFFPVALTGTEDGSFYVLGNYGGWEGTLYRYVYDPNIPTVPDTLLRVYSLYEDEDLRQMISQYQKSHPEVAIDLEIGLTGEDGVTEADAIRTLNTEILAGNGPDLLGLDGFSLDTYLEKGLLADLSGILTQAGPLLEQVTNCYASDGKVCAVPTTFAIPVIYGPGHIVSQIQDLDSLVSAVTQAKAENTQTRSVLNGMFPVMFADRFYDCCSAAWLRSDGTLDEEKLTEYYAAMQALFALDEDYRQELAELLAEIAAQGGFSYTPGDYTGMLGSVSVFLGSQYLTPGTLDGMSAWAYALAGDDQLDGFETVALSGQAFHVFLPRRIMGILTTSAYPEAAAQFLAFMLSEEVQANDLSTGFPVNKAVFDREIAEERTVDWSTTFSDNDGTMLTFQSQYPDAQRRQELKQWVDELTTPALTNRIIRNMVMEQMDACLNGELTPQQAAQAALRSLNLYLSE